LRIIYSKFLDRPADKIVFTDYWEIASRGSACYHQSDLHRRVTKVAEDEIIVAKKN
jgi:hypothetical protein